MQLCPLYPLLDAMVLLRPPTIGAVYAWREEAEAKRRSTSLVYTSVRGGYLKPLFIRLTTLSFIVSAITKPTDQWGFVQWFGAFEMC